MELCQARVRGCPWVATGRGNEGRRRTCLVQGSTIASVPLQGSTLALARIQRVLYITRRKAARPDQEGIMHIGVVCIPHLLWHVGEHLQPAHKM